MPAFRYTALTPAGEISRGVMEADSEAAVIDRLRKQGNIPMRADPASGSSFLSGLLHMEFGRGQAMGKQEVANFTRELAIMLQAGQDLDRSLRFLVDTAPNARVRGVVERMRDTVRDGGSLANALGQHPRSFPRLYVGLVRAGESGGHLADALERLAVLLERQRSLAATVTSAVPSWKPLIVACAVWRSS